MRVLSRSFLIITLAASLSASASAQAPKPVPKSPTTSRVASKTLPTHMSSGTIVSIDDKSLVISRKTGGKEQQVHFMLNPETKKTGNLTVGARVTVQYRVDNKENIATSIRDYKASGSTASKTNTKS